MRYYNVVIHTNETTSVVVGGEAVKVVGYNNIMQYYYYYVYYIIVIDAIMTTIYNIIAYNYIRRFLFKCTFFMTNDYWPACSWYNIEGEETIIIFQRKISIVILFRV